MHSTMRRLEVSGPSGAGVKRFRMMSGGSVLLIAASQLIVGLCIMGIYEGYKVYFFNTYIASLAATQRGEKDADAQLNNYGNPMDVRSPMVS